MFVVDTLLLQMDESNAKPRFAWVKSCHILAKDERETEERLVGSLLVTRHDLLVKHDESHP